MRKSRRLLRLFRVVAFVAALGLVAGAFASCGTPAPVPTPEVIRETVVVQQTVVVEATPEPAKEPIRIGVGEPFTGPLAWIGEDYNHGFTMAAEEINVEGGILGHPVQIIPCDNEVQPEKAIACVRRLVDQDQVTIIIGMGSSGTVLASMPVMEEYQVPFLGVGVTSADITKDTGRAGGNIWTFRMCAHDGMMAEAFADFVDERVDSISFLAWNDAYGRGAVEKMMPLLEERGVEVLSEDYFEAGQPDHRPLITRMKSLDAEGLYLVCEASDASTLVRQMRELGWSPEIFARGSVVSTEFLELIDDDPTLGEGIVEASFVSPLVDEEFNQRYFERWGSMPRTNAIGAYFGLRYVVAQAAETAIQETGDLTHSSLRDALENVSVETSIYGLIEFDEYNQAHPPVYVQQIDDGEIVLLATVPTD